MTTKRKMKLNLQANDHRDNEARHHPARHLLAVAGTTRRPIVLVLFLHDIVPYRRRILCLLQQGPQLRVPGVDELEGFQLCLVPRPAPGQSLR